MQRISKTVILSMCVLEEVDDWQRKQSIKFTFGISFQVSGLGLGSAGDESALAFYFCILHRAGGGIL